MNVTIDTSDATLKAVNLFNDAFNRHDVDAVMKQMTEDCVFESTSPAPDGGTFRGQDEVRACWQQLFQDSPDARFDTEEVFACGDRCTVRWIYNYTNADGTAGHVRGVDVLGVRDGRVSEKFAYVKG